MNSYPLTYNDFKAGLQADKLLGLKCLACGAYIIPPNAVCTSCASPKMEVHSFSKKGKVKTFTVIRVGPSGFRVPYVVAMVELLEGPWIMGNIVGIAPEDASMDLIGKEVSIGSKVLPNEDGEGSLEGVAITFSLLG